MTIRPARSAVNAAMGALVLLLAAATFPAAAQDAPLTRIAFGSCADQGQPQPIWDAVLDANPKSPRKARREHYPAPYALIETWRRAGGGVQRRLAAERRSVAKLAGTATARNLIRVFFLQERL